MKNRREGPAQQRRLKEREKREMRRSQRNSMTDRGEERRGEERRAFVASIHSIAGIQEKKKRNGKL